MTTGCRKLSDAFCAISRMTMSELPPGANGTSTVIGREGNSSAPAVSMKVVTAAATSIAMRRERATPMRIADMGPRLRARRGPPQSVDHRRFQQIGLQLGRVVGRALQLREHGAAAVR